MSIISKVSKPTISIVHTQQAGAGLVRIIADVVHTSTSKNNVDEVFAAFSGAADGRAQMIPETVKVLDENRFSQRIVAHVSLNRDVVAVTEDLKGFRAVASNMFMDVEDKMWSLRKTAGGDVLVQATDIDDEETLIKALSSLSSSRHDPSVGQFVTQCSSAVRAIGGDFVSYVSFDGKVKCGFVAVASDSSEELLIVPTEGEDEQIDADAVVDNYGEPEVDESEEEQVEAAVASARGCVGVEQIVAYYKRIYGRHPQYFNELVKRIRSHQFAC